jgi:hypothetical protein
LVEHVRCSHGVCACARAGKSNAELEEIEEGIQGQLDAGNAADPEFLGSVLRRLALYKAKAWLREFHERLLQRHVQRIVAAEDGAVDVAEAMGWNRDEVSA